MNAEDSWMDLHAVLDTDQISKKVRVDTDVLPSKPSSSMMYITPQAIPVQIPQGGAQFANK